MTSSYELAQSICKTLFDAGYTAYFAGGWVRDLLLEKPSDEIDIATSAPPHIIQKLFSKTIPVGIAYGVIIVVLEGKNFEVTTFRKDHPYLDGRHPEGVDFSTPEKDALRRDFTINGLFYDPLSDTIYDYIDGQSDLKKGIIRAIGDPDQRFTEDRLRMIRAVRFATRFNFQIEPRTEEAIKKHASSLFPSVSMERVWQEFNKMRPMAPSLLLLHQLEILSEIFPDLKYIPSETMKKQIEPLHYFPWDCPTIIYLMQLFPTHTIEEKIALCRYLKTTVKDMKLVYFFESAKPLFEKKETDRADWARFYAHAAHQLYLEIESAKILPPERLAFLQEHEKRKKNLKSHIDRIRKRHPLVNAARLQKGGIKPGKKMGELLKEAERIAINQDLHQADEVLYLLKQSDLWPQDRKKS